LSGNGKPDLTGMTLKEMEDFLQGLNEPRYRAQQIADWIYKKLSQDFRQMSNLSQRLQDELGQYAYIGRLDIQAEQTSTDQARKWLWRLKDGQTIESVLITEDDRKTACISSQVGCGMQCPFCATGKEGLIRNLSPAEIVGQVLTIKRLIGERVTNVVYMGMGEPLANYDSVIKSVKILAGEWGVGIGQRHITLSTCGIVPGIRRLAKEKLQIVLAVSLHAPTDELRDQLVPINKKYNLTELIKACQEYVDVTSRRVTLEYLLLDRVNDTEKMADLLFQKVKDLKCHINLIPFNPVSDSEFRRPSNNRVHRFADMLRQAGIQVTVRNSRGTDIKAACGQLRRNEND
jgi:23S rRNA (adenine2503-C2)-methyltransferase